MSNKKKTSKNKKNGVAGWKYESPSYRERSIMLRDCGKKCFLGTKKSFPICRKNTCTISSKGLHAAYIRARQYKYKNISKKAKNKLSSTFKKGGAKW